jgi:hypothetical protein
MSELKYVEEPRLVISIGIEYIHHAFRTSLDMSSGLKHAPKSRELPKPSYRDLFWNKSAVKEGSKARWASAAT